jgi:drug/metabolite transporter (DMT)-like permease
MGKKSPKNQPRWQSYAFLLLNTIVWGAAFVMVKPAFEVTTPLRFLFYRHLLAAFLALPLLWYYRLQIKKLGKKLWTIIGLELIGSTLALSLLYAGLNYTTVIEANLLGTSLPLFITLGGITLLKEKQELNEWFGLCIALVGTLYLTVFPLITTGSVTGISVLGNSLIILSHIANLFYYPLAKKYYTHIPKFLVTTISFWVGTVTFFLLSLLELRGSLPKLLHTITSDTTAPSVWVASGYMAVFGSIIGLTAYIKGQDGVEASEASLFYYLQPLVYLPLTFYLFGEVLNGPQLVSLIVILMGVLIAERRPGRRLAPAKSTSTSKK